MKPTEAVNLTRLVKALCPAQAWDEGTPDVWAVLLQNVPYKDAETAVAALGMRQRFIAPAEIVDEIKRIRDGRLVGIDQYRCAFPGNPDDTRAELTWWRAARERIADGETPDTVFNMPALTGPTHHPGITTGRDGAVNVAHTFRRPPRRA